jgi:hypothetical protein
VLEFELELELLLEFGVDGSVVVPAEFPVPVFGLLAGSRFREPLAVFGLVLMLVPVPYSDWLSNEPPRFSLDAQPAATNPANAVNAINFFIITPFDVQSMSSGGASPQSGIHPGSTCRLPLLV